MAGAPSPTLLAGNSVRQPVSTITLQCSLDPWFRLKALAHYASLSLRTIQNYVDDAYDPIPSYRVGRAVLVRLSDFDAWMARRRNRKATAAVELARADAAALLVARPRKSIP